jgi:hypothetical protein
MNNDKSELDKLEEYLKKRGIKYERVDEVPEKQIAMAKETGFYEKGMFERHQIIVRNGRKQWDVVCHWGSYGYSQGLLELYGCLVTKADGDDVVGWLTAKNVIDRIEAN